MIDRRRHQEERFKESHTVPGTCSYHFYEPVPNKVAVKFKRVNEDFGEVVFHDIPDAEKWQQMQFVNSKYDGFLWIGLILGLDRELEDAQIKFTYPTNRVYWPRRDDVCWVPFSQILYRVQPPTTYTGRNCNIDKKDTKKVKQAYT